MSFLLKDIMFTIQTMKGMAEAVKVNPRILPILLEDSENLTAYGIGVTTICGVPIFVTETVKHWEVTAEKMEITVFSWAYVQGLEILSYNHLRDEWLISDGEIYTTDCILKEVARNGDNRNSI